MNLVHIASVDLNLLVVFEALIRKRNVTQAGQEIGLSQSATSYALSRLRKLFQDELFVRTPDGMQPTAKAIALAPSIQQALEQIEFALTDAPTFTPETSERIFTLGMSDYGAFTVLPQLMQKLEVAAPGVRIRVRSLDWRQGLQMIDASEIDLGISIFPQQSSWHQSQLLFEERYVCVASQTFSQPMTLENYLAASHLLVSPGGEFTGLVDEVLAKQNLERHVAIASPHFLVAPFILASTNLVATLAERVAQRFADVAGLQIFPLPLKVPGFSMRMLWHSRNSNDPAHTWLRTTICTQ